MKIEFEISPLPSKEQVPNILAHAIADHTILRCLECQNIYIASFGGFYHRS